MPTLRHPIQTVPPAFTLPCTPTALGSDLCSVDLCYKIDLEICFLKQIICFLSLNPYGQFSTWQPVDISTH